MHAPPLGRLATQLVLAGAAGPHVVAIPCDNFLTALPMGTITDHDLVVATLEVEISEDPNADSRV